MTLWLARLFQRITDYFIARAEKQSKVDRWWSDCVNKAKNREGKS